MNNSQRIQKAVDYIEQHLLDDFSLKDVSATAFSSLSHFHRIFLALTGYSLKEYIRKRRLSYAAQQLHCGKDSITDIGLRVGYDTAESFSRAFKKHYECSPREFRNTNKEQLLEPKLDVLQQFAKSLLPDRDYELTVNYVLYEQQTIYGFQTHTTMENGQQEIDICNFSNEVFSSGKLADYFDMQKTSVYGLYTNMKDQNDFDYTIGCLKQSAIKSLDGLASHVIPRSRYARFTLNRLDRIKQAWYYIYGYWFLENDAERTKGFDFEIYYDDKVDIYIPMNHE